MNEEESMQDLLMIRVTSQWKTIIMEMKTWNRPTVRFAVHINVVAAMEPIFQTTPILPTGNIIHHHRHKCATIYVRVYLNAFQLHVVDYFACAMSNVVVSVVQVRKQDKYRR